LSAAELGLFIASSLRLAMPLLLAATGELVSEKAGVLNLSLEGMMLAGAFAAAMVSLGSGSPVLGLLAGIGASLIVALAQAVMSVTIRADQLVVGIGFNILILGVTTFLFREMRGAGASDLIPGLPMWSVPWLAGLPVLGPALFQHSSLFYVGLLLVAGTWALLAHTSFGLCVGAVGEDPAAADKAGVDVSRTRYLAVLYAGAMAGVAGSFLSIADLDTFTEGMTKGAGYLALASVIFGGWTGWRTAAACLLFGLATALQFLLPNLGFSAPAPLLLMLPYVMALLAVGGLVGNIRTPRALGVAFFRGH
jgi:general nucleoside transport system permease protein